MKSKKIQDFFKIKNIVILLLLTIFFIIDRYLKFLALGLSKDFFLVKNIFTFTFYANKNISFSLPVEGIALMFLIGALILLIIFYLIKAFKKGRFLEVFAWLAIILGAFSNLIDRLKYSYVIDYLDVAYFTVLNLADVMISLGCFYIIFSNLFKKEIKK